MIINRVRPISLKLAVEFVSTQSCIRRVLSEQQVARCYLFLQILGEPLEGFQETGGMAYINPTAVLHIE